MFIREVKTKNKKTNEIYIKHLLVESVRDYGNPRQRLIMNLGRLDLPRREWKKLAHALECQLSGQTSLLEFHDKYIDDLALSLVSNHNLAKILNTPETTDEQTDTKNYIAIDTDSVHTEKIRTLGAELICQNTWELLEFDEILKSCGFSQLKRAAAKALVFGRLISPGSEWHIINWYRKRSALSEFPKSDVVNAGKDIFYRTSDKLYENKDKIEEFLFNRQKSRFPSNGNTIFLYDLTNTYMEGSGLHNKLAARGHCKSKRSDCPLITLSLIVRNDGMPVASHIYKGNQSEPETMEDMIKRIETLLGYDSPQITIEKPTIVMDRGIATIDNVKLLKSKCYQYIVVTREDQTGEYYEEFEKSRETFTRIDDLSHKRTAYGDENHVYVKKIMQNDENTCKVLCLSEGKVHKENAIAAKKESYYVADVEKLNRSIFKGSIKNTEKIKARLDRIKKRHKTISEKYNDKIMFNEHEKIKNIEIAVKSTAANPLSGCYVIESTHKELSETEIWHLYMTQTRVESSFRAMKSELGMRPIYHQNEPRTSAHLFITFLAYHILSAIERRLAQENDTRQWQTLREVLSTHVRTTVVMKDKDGFIYHKRASSKAEDNHQDIYIKLGINDITKTVISSFK
jgi:transposase